MSNTVRKLETVLRVFFAVNKHIFFHSVLSLLLIQCHTVIYLFQSANPRKMFLLFNFPINTHKNIHIWQIKMKDKNSSIQLDVTMELYQI
jgi:hypothetical protein